MRYLPLLWAGLFRKKTRTILTLLSIVVAFALFGLLQAVQVAFESGADAADAKRLLTTARYSIIEPLPDVLPAPDRAGAGRGGRGLRGLVRGQVPERVQRLPGLRGGSGALSRHVPGVHHRARASRGVRADAHRRDRGPAAGRSLRLEGRAEAADQLGDPSQDGRQHELGVRPGRHPRRRRSGGARQHRHGPDQRGLLRRGPPDRPRQDRLVHRAGGRLRPGPRHLGHDRRACSRTRPTRPRPSPRRSSRWASPSRSATSARWSPAS